MKLNTDRIKLEITRARKPVALLLLTALCAGTASWVIFKNQTFKRPWTDYYEVTAQFEDVKGITDGTQQPVRIAGVQVGVVRKNELINGRPVLTIALERQYAPLYRDARMRIRPVTPLQDMFVTIEDRGSPAAGELREGELLTAERTVSPVDISRVMNAFDAPTRDRLGHLLNSLGEGLADRGDSLRAAFAESVPFLVAARDVSAALADRKQALARFVRNFGRVTTELGRRDRQLASLVRNGNSSLGELAENDEAFAATIEEMAPTLTELQRSLGALRVAEEDIDPALRALRPVADRLGPGIAALGRFSREATPALRALRAPVRKLRPFAVALAPSMTSLDQAFREMTPDTPKYYRLTKTFAACRDSFKRMLHATAWVMNYGDALSAYPRTATSVAFDGIDGGGERGLVRRTLNNCDVVPGGTGR